MATETLETTLKVHNGDGTAGPFSYDFTPYEADDIHVFVLNENEASAVYGKYEPKTVTTHYTVDLTNKRITFTSGNFPATSTNNNVLIERRTDVTDASPRRKVFQAGSSIKAGDLNQNQLQALDGVEDLWDKKISKINPTVYGNFEFPVHQRFEGTQLKGDLLVREDKVIIFEGATDDAYETRLEAIDPTADRTIKLPNNDGTIIIDNLRHNGINIGQSDGKMNKSDVGGDLTVSYNSSTDKAEFTVTNVAGANITNDIEVKAGKAVKFEGATDNSYETTLQAEDPTADNVISLPNATGTVMLDNLRHHAIIIGESNGTGNKADVGGDLTAAYNPDTDKAEFTIANNAVSLSKVDTSSLDGRYYTKTGSPDDVIKSSETWPTDSTKDDFVVTPGSVDARIVTLVDEVGGFVAIDNETSFPNTNPDVNDGAGTIVSIKSLASPFTSSGSGVATIANGTVGNSTVTINGLANSTTYGAGLGMLVETTTTLNTYKFHRSTPLAADVATVAAKSTEVGRLGTADAVADMAILGTTDCVADMAILATTDVVADLNTLGTADIVSDLDAVADIAANVTTVADNSTNINTVATNATSIATCANNISDVNNFGDLYQIGTSAPDKDGGNNDLAAGDMWFDSSSNKTLKVHNGTSFQSVSPAQSVLDDISIVSGSLSRQEDMGAITDAISTGSATGSLDVCATNITNINTFANVYRIDADPPNTSLDEGDLWYDSTNNKLKYYNGSAWAVTAAAGLSSISDDTSPELAANLDCNDKNLTEVATVSGDNLQIDFGTIA